MSVPRHFPLRVLRGFAVVALLALLLAGAGASLLQAVPIITSTKVDTLIVDVDADNSADPGDTIRYTNIVTNSGSTDAGAVVFNDTIDNNTTLVAGSLRTTPIARNDSYSSLGNVGISVPPASGVLANDTDPDGQSVSAIPAAGGTANGGAFAIGADGSFSYLPPAGFEGADTFNYLIQDTDGNQDPATVFIVVNEVIWYIDNSLSSSGSGVLGNPFNSLSAFNSGAADEAGDVIFIYSGSGNYSSGITLLDNQTLIGQGASASIAAITGITVPPHSNALPATGGTRPAITTTAGDGVVLAQNNTLRGFNVGNTAGAGISDNGGTVGALTVSEVALTGSGEGFEADNGGALAVTLDSLNANSGAHGLSLANTSGSFSVTGTGGANSGGALSGHSAEGVLLNNVANVSLTDMVINQSATAGTQGIDASDVTGLTLVRTTITAGSGNAYALLGSAIRNWTSTSSVYDGGGGSVPNIDGVRITNLLGTNTLIDSTFRNGKDINLLIENNINGGGLDTITISGAGFSNSAGGDHLQVEADGTANLKLVVNAGSAGNTTFSGTGQDGIQLEAEGNSTFQAVISGSTFNNTLGSAVNLGAVVNGHMIARVHGLTGLSSSGTNVINMINFDTSLIEATIENNTITSATAGNGIRVIQEGNGTITANLANNTISGITQGSGILVQGRAGTGGNGRINATINGNNVTTTGALSLDGIEVTSGSSAGGDTNTICLNLLNNTSSSGAFDGYFLRHRSGSTFQLQDFAGPATSAGITTWVNTTKSNTGSVFVSDAGGFTAAPSACATPTVPVADAPAANFLVRHEAPHAAQMLASRLQERETRLAQLTIHESAALTRRTAAAAQTRPLAHVAARPALSGETLNVTLGTLNPGQVVVITFDVTVDDPQSPVTNSQVCNQGVVSSDNVANVLTNDPAVGGSADPTCTPLAPGTIIIAKDQSPDGSSSFGFSSNIPGNAAFNVGGDSSLTINNVPPGSYTVTEDDPAAGFFALTGLDCDDDASAAPSTTDLGARTATVNLESGETVTCTFSNEQQASIEVAKVIDFRGLTPNGDTFDLLIDGNVEASSVGDGGSTGQVGVALGSHTVSETGANLTNYDIDIGCVEQNSGSELAFATGASINTGPLSPGDNVLCTITNTHKIGSLEIVKDLYPATDPGTFDLIIDGNVGATGGDAVTTGEQSVLVGSHLIGEMGNLTDLSDYAVSISCRDNDGAGSEVPATPNGAFAWDVTIHEGDDIVCTITNTRKGTINIVKQATPEDDAVFSFNHDIDGGGSFTLQDPSDDTETFSNIIPGSYTVSEDSLPAGWDLSDITCSEDQVANSTEDEGNAQALITLDPGETVSCTFNNVFNRAPVANDDAYTATEDTTLIVTAPGVLDNDTDADNDGLAAVLDGATSNGALTLNGDGSFSYEPDADFCGPDGFTYHANDGLADSNVATANITVECVDDPPVVTVDVASQNVQYSDLILPVTVSASDVDSHPLSIDDDAPTALSTAGSCTADGSGGTACSWTLSGQVLVVAGAYNVTFTVADATNDVTAATQIVVSPEEAAVAFDGDNPVSVQVEEPGGDSGPFSLIVYVTEKEPDVPSGAAAPGDISLAVVSATLAPVGPGGSSTANCTAGGVSGTGYDAVLTVTCVFDDVPVNTYTVEVAVGGGYYSGSGEDVLTVYDPSLGFTTGGGWFYWPGTSDRTNFGYTMKYNRRGTNVQGSLLLIRHTADGGSYRLKSNALDGLAIGEGEESAFGWATFTGRATYREPGWPEPLGNYEFTVYVEDHGEPGAGNDRFWLQVRDKDDVVVGDLSLPASATDNAVTLEGGNIVVPHGGSGRGGGTPR